MYKDKVLCTYKDKAVNIFVTYSFEILENKGPEVTTDSFEGWLYPYLIRVDDDMLDRQRTLGLELRVADLGGVLGYQDSPWTKFTKAPSDPNDGPFPHELNLSAFIPVNFGTQWF